MKTKSELLFELQMLYDKMLAVEDSKAHLIEMVMPQHRESVINLIDYIVFRSENIHALQESLHYYGLSSLASSESHIKAQLYKVMQLLGNTQLPTPTFTYFDGLNQLKHNVKTLLGNHDNSNLPSIMVTIDSEFSNDFQHICDLLQNGMHIARINCAHDDVSIWFKMIKNIKKASIKMHIPCKIYMDLAGPKMRTQILGKGQKEGKIKVKLDEEILLLGSEAIPAKYVKAINCTLPDIIKRLQYGQRVLFDDGLFEAIVVRNLENAVFIKIVRISAKKPFIKQEKGINFPDTSFQVNPLTVYDLQCLPFIVEHADMVGFSFVNKAADIQALQAQLALLDKPDFAIVAKIETNEAVNNLPALILQGMEKGSIGVMIARGDLAVEIGFERLSEVQEEILWICEAAHTPVIWATQVLENLNKQGLATRGEITDAAHAALADCVMINKGRYTLDVLKSLRDILTRSRQHNFKQRHIFRELGIAKKFLVTM